MKQSSVLNAVFRDHFGHEAETQVFAPGRVNLIGEHTDYNLVTIRVDVLASAVARGHWSDYVIGTARELLNEARGARGLDLHIATDLPHGGGLSSSAAITVGTATVLDTIWDCGLSRKAIAKTAQAAENRFVGMQCGILDPFAIAMGQAGCALFVDCRTLAFEPIHFPVDSHTIVVAHTGIRRELATSAYNERRRQCEEAARVLAGDRAPRPLSAFAAEELDGLETHAVLLRRARHIVSENERVRQAAEALERGDVARFGELLLASHESLRRDYEVSCEELDLMVEEAMALGAAGAKMTGAGFGGAAIAVVPRDMAGDFSVQLRRRYRERTSRIADIFQCDPADGARRLDRDAAL